MAVTELKTPLYQRVGENLYLLNIQTTAEQVKMKDAEQGESSVQQEIEALREAVKNVLAANDAMVFKGVVNQDSDIAMCLRSRCPYRRRRLSGWLDVQGGNRRDVQGTEMRGGRPHRLHQGLRRFCRRFRLDGGADQHRRGRDRAGKRRERESGLL